MTPYLAHYLREYRAERESLYLGMGQILSPDDFVFGDDAGQPIDPSVLSHNFGRIVKKAAAEQLGALLPSGVVSGS